MSKWLDIVLIFGTGFVVGGTFDALMHDYGDATCGREKEMRAEAIKAGVAEYVITDPETGAVEFRWRKP